jgi:penicillin-binding protein 1A
MVRVDRRTSKRVLDGWPTGDPRGDVIWEAFKPDTEPDRATRQDEIAAKRDEILNLIRASRRAAGEDDQGNDGEPSDFVEEQGGIY